MGKEKRQEEREKTARFLEMCVDEELRRELEVLEALESSPAGSFVPFNVRIPKTDK